MYMSDQGVFLSKWPHNWRIILAKEQLGHSYIFWTMPILIFCQFANFGNQSLPCWRLSWRIACIWTQFELCSWFEDNWCWFCLPVQPRGQWGYFWQNHWEKKPHTPRYGPGGSTCLGQYYVLQPEGQQKINLNCVDFWTNIKIR